MNHEKTAGTNIQSYILNHYSATIPEEFRGTRHPCMEVNTHSVKEILSLFL